MSTIHITAESKYVRMTPRKVRLVTHAVRRLSLTKALLFLERVNKKAAVPIQKTIKSALANAKHNHSIADTSLILESIQVNEGPKFKRWRPVSRGMAHGYEKRMSHIQVVLTAKKVEKKVSSGKTKEVAKKTKEATSSDVDTNIAESSEPKQSHTMYKAQKKKITKTTQAPVRRQTRQKKGM